MRQRTGFGLKIVVALVALLLCAPTLLVIPMGFNDATTFGFPPTNWSTRWYQELLANPAWRDALFTSVEIGLAVAVLSTVLGTMAALAIDRSTGRLKNLWRAALMAPLTVPNIVVAVAVYSTFLRWHLSGTVLGFVLAHTVLAVPFVLVAVGASLTSFDRRLETAATSLGASPLQTFRSVTLPLLLPGVLSGAVFAFVTSFDEVVIALFLQSPTLTTLPVKMYQSVTIEIDPTIAAAASVVVVIVSLLVLLPQLFAARRAMGDAR
jgi:putative spermidine/putrescine transport system permease protein